MGVLTRHGIQVRIREGTQEDIMDLRLGIIKRTPEEWMDPATGPEQLALAILADATADDAYAKARYQQFTEDVTWHLYGPGGWQLPLSEVIQWITEHPLPLDDR